MDAGVPLTRPVAGIAMGLIKEGDDYVDPLRHRRRRGPPRRHGLQGRRHRRRASPPCRWTSRSRASRSRSCATRSRRPRRAATFILGKMAEAIGAPREQLSEHAPRISSIQIDPEKIGLLIGKGGETIRSLQEEYESQIDVNDEGMVLVYAVTGAKGDALVERIRSMTKEVEVGDEFQRQGRQDHDVRRLRRARQGHRRPAAHLQRLAGQPRRHGRGGAQQGRRDRRPRRRGRQGARPHRPAPRRGPGDRRQDQGGARLGRHRRPDDGRRRRPTAARAAAAATAAAAAAAAAAVAAVAVTVTAPRAAIATPTAAN